MDVEARQNLLRQLEIGKVELLAAVEGVTEEEAARAPGAGKWSVLECVEHVATAEDYLFSQIEAAQPASGEVFNRDREARILVRGLDRSTKVTSPKEGLPAGRYASLAHAVGHFVESRARTIRFVESCEHDLRAQLTTHPIIGRANCYEMLLMMVLHPRRHAKQIAEIRGTREIRFLTEADAEIYSALRLEALEREPEAFSSSPEQHRVLSMDEIRQRLGGDPENNFVAGAFVGARLGGIAGFVRTHGWKQWHKGMIWGVYVTAEVRGQGIGRALMRAVLDRAARLPDMEQILISVTTTQAPAAALYRSLGFETFGTEYRALKIGSRYLDEQHMVLFLSERTGPS
jgi:ribosomal protein S18 acetylase RimI-like enzyme